MTTSPTPPPPISAPRISRKQLYIQGLTDFLSVLQAQFNLFTSQDALAQSEGSIALDLVALYKALGGGWEPVPPAPDRDAAPTTAVSDRRT